MRAYLDAMDNAPYHVLAPVSKSPRVLAALGPKMLQLSASAPMAHILIITTPQHTAQARDCLALILICARAGVSARKRSSKREPSRVIPCIYLTLPITRQLVAARFSGSGHQDGGSHRLVDAVIAWGDVKSVLSRVQEHHAAGADHVCISGAPPTIPRLPDTQHRELASAIPRK